MFRYYTTSALASVQLYMVKRVGWIYASSANIALQSFTNFPNHKFVMNRESDEVQHFLDLEAGCA